MAFSDFLLGIQIEKVFAMQQIKKHNKLDEINKNQLFATAAAAVESK